MVVSNLVGRLGNQLFEVGAGLSLANKLNTDFYIKDYINQGPYQMIEKFHKYNNNENRIFVKESDDFTFIKLPDNKEYNYELFGYWQTEKYMDKKLIRNLFKISDSLKKKMITKYGNLSEAVGIHIRRGDYLKNENKRIFIQPNINWYKSIYEKYFKGKKVIVCSDDIEWCKNNLNIPNAIYANGTPEEDLYTLSECKHHICSNSSFSWWGAWLNEKEDSINIFPSKWFTEESKIKDDNLIPDRWIKEN